HRRVIARAHFLLYWAGGRTRSQRSARQNVVEPPTDVPRAHVPPRRPPGEQRFVFRVERTSDVDEPAGDDSLELGALFRQLTDGVRFPFFRVDFPIGPGHVQIPAERDGALFLPHEARKRFHRLEKTHLRGKVASAVWNVDGRYGDAADLGADDPVL